MRDSIEDYRAQIDEIDAQIVALLEKRMEISEQIGIEKLELRGDILDPKREWEKLNGIREATRHVPYREYMERIFIEIMAESRYLQKDIQNSMENDNAVGSEEQ